MTPFGVGPRALSRFGAAARRVGCLAIAAVLHSTATAQTPGAREPALPMRNLLVELRETSAAQSSRQDAGVQGGSVVIGSDGRVQGAASMRVEGRSGDATRAAVQLLRVLNGGRASLRLARSVPLQFYEVAWTPRGAAVVASTLWTEVGQGVQVQPRWPGGAAPATVEIRAEAQPMPDRPGETGLGGGASMQLLTTLSMPLGEWVTLASTVQDDAARRDGSFGTASAASSEQRSWQLRVTAP